MEAEEYLKKECFKRPDYEEQILDLMKGFAEIKCKELRNLQIEIYKNTIGFWWNTWHRFAEEEDAKWESDSIPKHIKDINIELEKDGIKFDLMDGGF